MAESTESLTQRVEALEQISHARVIERVGQVEQRVSRIESAREAEEPHVATKADVARLETLVSDTRAELKAEISDSRTELKAEISDSRAELKAEISDSRAELKAEISDSRTALTTDMAQMSSELQAQAAENKTALEKKITQYDGKMERKLRHFLMWLIGTAIALSAVIIAAAAFVIAQLP